MLGLKHKQNLLVEYDPDWPRLFADEKARIERALQGLARGIEHYGSTAVEGLRAKPILDILVGVLPIENWAHCQVPLEALGYDYAEGAGVAGHFIFGRGRDRTERTHLVHVVEFGGESWCANLRFRDALRGDPDLCERYVTLKKQAVQWAPEGRSQYNEHKYRFIEEVKKQLP